MDFKVWGKERNTSESIARAIHELAEGDAVEVERIWQYPTDEQLSAIWRWSTNSGQIDARKLIWNSRPLAEIML